MFSIDRILNSFKPFSKPAEKPPTEKPQTGPAAARPVSEKDALKLSSKLPAADAIAPASLSSEEQSLQQARLLPENYAELKAVMLAKGVDAAKQLYRKGKNGPFSPDFGNPIEMLKAAKRIQASPELSRLVKDVRKGDIVVETYNKPDDPITRFTKGPFVHASICISDEAPPQFIEAVGITGSSGDPTTNRVRYTTLSAHDTMTYRIVRPTEGMDEPAKSHAINRAIRYSEEQLGKSYDYAFTDRNRGSGVTDAYYCSELTYLAYASPDGANLNMPVGKSTERDEIIVALNAVVDALQPTNKAELMDEAMKLVKRNPKPTTSDMVAFIVDEVMTKCEATEDLTRSDADRDRLKKTVESLMEGKAFGNLHFALGEYHQQEASGQFDTPVIGWGRQQKARAAIALGFAKDAGHLLGTSGLDFSETAKTTWNVLAAVLPHSEVLASFLFGPNDGRTQAVGKVLDSMEWVQKHAPDLPVVGDFGLHNLPERAKPSIKTDFVSPTDLAWSGLSGENYNVLPGHPVDQKAFERTYEEDPVLAN